MSDYDINADNEPGQSQQMPQQRRVFLITYSQANLIVHIDELVMEGAMA